jgi:hypothetical protein
MMRQQIPLAITFVTGLAMVIQYFVPHDPFGGIQQEFNQWYLIVAAFAMVLGVGNLIKLHSQRIRRQGSGWGYSIILLISLGSMGLFGIVQGITEGTVYYYLWQNMMIPLGATMFSLLAFFVASASYRAFRARNREAALLLVAATLVMIGRVPVGEFIYSGLPVIADWIMNIPNTAGQRAILIGIALGTVSASLRLILGIERAYLAGD